MSERVRIDSLVPYPGNPRVGDIDAIAASLAAFAQFEPVVAQRSTRRILAGNNTCAAARDRLGWSEIDVTWVDVDDREARIIVLGDNRLADRRSYDDLALVELLGDIDLEGTGFDKATVEALAADLAADMALDLGDTRPARDAKEPTEQADPVELGAGYVDLPGIERLPLTDTTAERLVARVRDSGVKADQVLRTLLRLPAGPVRARKGRLVETTPPDDRGPVLAEYDVPVGQLRAHLRNPNQGDVGAISVSLNAVGQYRPVIAQRDGTIIVHTHVWLAARALAWPTVRVVWSDYPPDIAERVMVAANRTQDLATYDTAALLAMLETVPADDLPVTGWDRQDMDDLHADLNDHKKRAAIVDVNAASLDTRWKVRVGWRDYDQWMNTLLADAAHTSRTPEQTVTDRLDITP